jgi:hypothetical protein
MRLAGIEDITLVKIGTICLYRSLVPGRHPDRISGQNWTPAIENCPACAAKDIHPGAFCSAKA